MKLHVHDFRLARAGYTLLEVLIATGIFTLVGGLVFVFLNSGLTLYAKNTAVNAAHQQARAGVDEMLNYVHSAVSIPSLVDIQVVSGIQRMTNPSATEVGPKPGITFQRFDAGPFKLAAGAIATDNIVSVTVNGYTPRAIVRLNIPSYQIESDVVASRSSVSNGTWNAVFSQPIGKDIVVRNDRAVIGFTTYRVGYLVVGGNTGPGGTFLGELRFYPSIDPLNTDINDPAKYKVVARNVTSATPFKILLNANGGLNNRSVAAVELSTADPQYSNRGYAAVNMFINSYIPFRSLLTNTQ